MYCTNCGAKTTESASFCNNCGYSLKKEKHTEPQATEVLLEPQATETLLEPQTTEILLERQTTESLLEPQQAYLPESSPITDKTEIITDLSYEPSSSYENSVQAEGHKKASKFKPVYAIIAGALLVVLVGTFFGVRMFMDSTDRQNTIASNDENSDSDDWEYFSDSDDFDNSDNANEPHQTDLTEQASSEASTTTQDESIALAQVVSEAKMLVAGGKLDDALNVLNSLPILSDSKYYDEYQNHINALSTKLAVKSMDISEFPKIYIHIERENSTVEAGDISIKDKGQEVVVDGISKANNEIVVEYTSDDALIDGENRTVSIDVAIGEFSFPLTVNYITPVLQNVDIMLVSTDFSNYPTVRAFFRVKDASNNRTVTSIAPNSFSIKESVSGGEYLAREVKSAEAMISDREKYGLNISLVADKSDSIEYDMHKIKTVMREFVGRLSLTGGDKAELIAFDDVPQIMCTFTNDSSLLYNGINNMETDGMTALYDAIYQGIRDAALKGGARCVIAFTDGGDNMSWFTENDVIRYAKEKQVPLYIIGVGYGSSQEILRTMASETNGYYWNIDDLYDLSEIYAQIYSELQELYVVSYESDAAVDSLTSRDLIVSMRGGGYKGDTTTSFSPAKTAGVGSGSRYEIFLEDVSWEEANERCLERGGHLVTITSKAEEAEITALAEANAAKYVWLGGYTSYDYYNTVFAHWITGESFTYNNWMMGEPSRVDEDGTPEKHLMLWNLENEGWTWNDQRNDVVTLFPYYKGKLAYVCEYE